MLPAQAPLGALCILLTRSSPRLTRMCTPHTGGGMVCLTDGDIPCAQGRGWPLEGAQGTWYCNYGHFIGKETEAGELGKLVRLSQGPTGTGGWRGNPEWGPTEWQCPPPRPGGGAGVAVSFYVLPEWINSFTGSHGQGSAAAGDGTPPGGRDPCWGGRLGAQGGGDPAGPANGADPCEREGPEKRLTPLRRAPLSHSTRTSSHTRAPHSRHTCTHPRLYIDVTHKPHTREPPRAVTHHRCTYTQHSSHTRPCIVHTHLHNPTHARTHMPLSRTR